MTNREKIMMELCKNAGLPKPEFQQDGGFFVQTLWRDYLTEAVLASLHLNERQHKAVTHIKQNRAITNLEYQKLNNVSPRTALRDIDDMLDKGLLNKSGNSARTAQYSIKSKPSK